MTTVIMQIFNITKAATAAIELFQTIDRASHIDPMATDGLRPEHCIGNIELKDVVFSYPSRPDSQVLSGLSLSVPAGKTTALVGASGSGKSTCVALLERWYDQTAGSITLDGQDIRDLNLRYLRTKIRLVQQEPVLFSGTVFDNVAYGLLGTEHENASAEKKLQLVQDACKDAFAHEFVEQLPERYFTQIGERARMLSGGRFARSTGLHSSMRVFLMIASTRHLRHRDVDSSICLPNHPLTTPTQVRSRESPSLGASSPIHQSYCSMKRPAHWTLEPRKSYSKRSTTLARTVRRLASLTSSLPFRKQTTSV